MSFLPAVMLVGLGLILALRYFPSVAEPIINVVIVGGTGTAIGGVAWSTYVILQDEVTLKHYGYSLATFIVIGWFLAWFLFVRK